MFSRAFIILEKLVEKIVIMFQIPFSLFCHIVFYLFEIDKASEKV